MLLKFSWQVVRIGHDKFIAGLEFFRPSMERYWVAVILASAASEKRFLLFSFDINWAAGAQFL